MKEEEHQEYNRLREPMVEYKAKQPLMPSYVYEDIHNKEEMTMTKSTMAMEAEKAELARIILALDDMELVKKVKASIKRITTSEEDSFFTNPANLAHFQKSVKQRENGAVVELTPELQKELLGL
ncbi:MAG: hypothetical protein LUH63_05130 [Parabacteroides sp.]|nr:hypothetical protein [Parabacteroides sp.]